MVDSHCHLADEAFVTDLPAVVARARAAGLTGALTVLAIGDEAEQARAARVSDLWPEVRFAIGIHPHQAGVFAGPPGRAADAVREAVARMPLVRAVGEIGLDYHYNLSPPEVQRTVFRAQVRLAKEIGLPVVIHTRDAEVDTMAVLDDEAPGGMRGVLHCFTGSERLAAWALGFGLSISFAGIVTFPKAEPLRQVARIVPPDRLLVETDSPYLAPVPHRGTRNEPAWVQRVVSRLAEVRQVAAGDLASSATAAYVDLFRP